MGDSIKNLAEVKVDDIHCSPPIYPAGDAIIEGNKVGRAQFPLGESMLTTPHNFLVLRCVLVIKIDSIKTPIIAKPVDDSEEIDFVS